MHNKLIYKVTADKNGGIFIENRKNHVVAVVDARGLDKNKMTPEDYDNRVLHAISDAFRTNVVN